MAVFIDYGPEWEAAWSRHVEEWTPPDENYIPASTLQHEPLLQTESEQLADPYPDNIIFYCHYDYEIGDPAKTWRWEDDWIGLPWYPCKVISRSEVKDGKAVGYLYNMQMLTEDEIEEGRILAPHVAIPSGGDHSHVLSHVPRWAIEAKDKLYTKDEFVTKSLFRHEMMMPDDIFPKAWMNK